MMLKVFKENLVDAASLQVKKIWLLFYRDLTKKNELFQGWSWFKPNNLGLERVMITKTAENVPNTIKLQNRECYGQTPSTNGTIIPDVVGRE